MTTTPDDDLDATPSTRAEERENTMAMLRALGETDQEWVERMARQREAALDGWERRHPRRRWRDMIHRLLRWGR